MKSYPKINYFNKGIFDSDCIGFDKLDGSNFCMTNQECFARSHNGPPTHQSFDWAKAFHNQVRFSIPNNLAIYAEYCFAKHSIHYTKLPHYLYIFNVLNLDKNEWLSWQDVENIAQELLVPTVPVLYKGMVASDMELQNLCQNLIKLHLNSINLRCRFSKEP